MAADNGLLSFCVGRGTGPKSLFLKFCRDQSHHHGPDKESEHASFEIQRVT